MLQQRKFNMKIIKLFLIMLVCVYCLYKYIDWDKKILLAVYVPENNKSFYFDNERNNFAKNLFFGIPSKGEDCKVWFTDQKTIVNMVKDADIKYPKAIEIRLKFLSNPNYSLRYIKDKKSNWILAN